MSELQPLFVVMSAVGAIFVIPSAVICWIWGGKAVVYLCAALGLATIAFLAWFALTANFSTGMEGLAFIIWPLLYSAVCFGAILGFAIVRIVKSK